MTDHPKPTSDLNAWLLAEGAIDPSDAQVAAVVSGMVQRIMRTAYSMTVEDADKLVEYAGAVLNEAKKRNDPEIAQYAQGLTAAKEFARYRRRLERLRQ